MKLEIAGLQKRYGTHVALDGLDLTVDGGRVLVFVGPSGGGKSTLLRILGGLERPDAGTIRVSGEPLPDTERDLLAYRRRNGFLFQQFNLFPHLDALRNLTLPLEKVHGLTPSEALQAAEDALERFGLIAHASKKPAQLSGGQQQRVGIARAIASRPEILFLDEPTSALDPEMTAEVLELIQELAEAGQRIVLSTHEMGFARAVGDRIAFLAGGRVLETAPPVEWFARPSTEPARKFLSRVLRYA